MTKINYPEICVGTLIFNSDEIFLMRSHKFKGKYVIPGGHIEFGERIEDALKREIKEETGLDIDNLEFICMQECIFDGENFYEPNKHFIFLDYSCRTNSKNVKLNEEGQSYVWVSLNDAEKLDIEPYTRKVIERYLTK